MRVRKSWGKGKKKTVEQWPGQGGDGGPVDKTGMGFLVHDIGDDARN